VPDEHCGVLQGGGGGGGLPYPSIGINDLERKVKSNTISFFILYV
jgi:hypothetical protein